LAKKLIYRFFYNWSLIYTKKFKKKITFFILGFQKIRYLSLSALTQ